MMSARSHATDCRVQPGSEDEDAMHSHGKLFYVPALCIVMLALVTGSSAALSGCKTAEAARLQPDAKKDAQITTAIQAKLASLASESEVKPFEIAVTTQDGVERVIDLVKVGDRQ